MPTYSDGRLLRLSLLLRADFAFSSALQPGLNLSRHACFRPKADIRSPAPDPTVTLVFRANRGRTSFECIIDKTSTIGAQALPTTIGVKHMPKLLVTHEVNDVAHWLSSTKRQEVFAGVAENISTYVNPDDPNSVGLTMDVADMAAFEAVLKGEAGAAAMMHDGVRPQTVVVFVEA